MSMHSNHPYHLVDFSPWPLTGAMGTFILVSGLIKWFHSFNMYLLILGILIIILTKKWNNKSSTYHWILAASLTPSSFF